MPTDVVNEMAEAIDVVPGSMERVEKPPEHFRDDVFAAVKESRQDLFGRARIGDPHRMRDKGLHMGRCTDLRQGYFDLYADQRKQTQLLELARHAAAVPDAADGESAGAH